MEPKGILIVILLIVSAIIYASGVRGATDLERGLAIAEMAKANKKRVCGD